VPLHARCLKFSTIEGDELVNLHNAQIVRSPVQHVISLRVTMGVCGVPGGADSGLGNHSHLDGSGWRYRLRDERHAA
jgi:hypothetical protein